MREIPRASLLKALTLAATGGAVLLLSACGGTTQEASPVGSVQEITSTQLRPTLTPSEESPCKNDEGTIGSYVYMPESNDWQCDSTDDPAAAPPIPHTTGPSQLKADPTGFQCANQDGRRGQLEWIDPNGPWTCMS